MLPMSSDTFVTYLSGCSGRSDHQGKRTVTRADARASGSRTRVAVTVVWPGAKARISPTAEMVTSSGLELLHRQTHGARPSPSVRNVMVSPTPSTALGGVMVTVGTRPVETVGESHATVANTNAVAMDCMTGRRRRQRVLVATSQLTQASGTGSLRKPAVHASVLVANARSSAAEHLSRGRVDLESDTRLKGEQRNAGRSGSCNAR